MVFRVEQGVKSTKLNPQKVVALRRPCVAGSRRGRCEVETPLRALGNSSANVASCVYWGMKTFVSHTDEGWMQGAGSCGVEGVALGESPFVLSDCQPWAGLERGGSLGPACEGGRLRSQG